MDKLINDFSWGLVVFQLLNIALLVLLIVFIVRLYKYFNTARKS
jgi:hypothetical protein